MEEDNNDYDYEAAKVAELQEIYDQQLREYVLQFDVYSMTFAKFPTNACHDISTNARQMRKFTSTSLSYGEIEFESFGSLICSLTKHGIDLGCMNSFADLGSGVGKTVIAAALLGIFDKCIGIEILVDLHKTSTQILKQFYRLNQNNAEIVAIEFIAGDASFVDWSTTDMVFAHATCFDEANMKRIANTSCKMKEGSVFITISNRLPREDMFALVATADVKTSWGGATAFVYKRNSVAAPDAVQDALLHLHQVLTREIPI